MPLGTGTSFHSLRIDRDLARGQLRSAEDGCCQSPSTPKGTGIGCGPASDGLETGIADGSFMDVTPQRRPAQPAIGHVPPADRQCHYAHARAFYLLDKVAALDVVDDPRPEVVDALFIKHSDGLDGVPWMPNVPTAPYFGSSLPNAASPTSPTAAGSRYRPRDHGAIES